MTMVKGDMLTALGLVLAGLDNTQLADKIAKIQKRKTTKKAYLEAVKADNPDDPAVAEELAALTMLESELEKLQSEVKVRAERENARVWESLDAQWSEVRGMFEAYETARRRFDSTAVEFAKSIGRKDSPEFERHIPESVKATIVEAFGSGVSVEDVASTLYIDPKAINTFATENSDGATSLLICTKPAIGKNGNARGRGAHTAVYASRAMLTRPSVAKTEAPAVKVERRATSRG